MIVVRKRTVISILYFKYNAFLDVMEQRLYAEPPWCDISTEPVQHSYGRGM